MCSVFQTDDERPTFRPFTRESLAKIEARIQEHNAKTKDLERKRAEGEVRVVLHQFSSIFFHKLYNFFLKNKKTRPPLSLNLIYATTIVGMLVKKRFACKVEQENNYNLYIRFRHTW